MALKRLQKELIELRRNPIPIATVTPSADDPFQWKALLFGPKDTPYEGGVFELHITFPHDYPSRPPVIRFITTIFHANIHKNGSICLDLFTGWLPNNTVTTALFALNSLLSNKIADEDYNQKAKHWTQTYAMNR